MQRAHRICTAHTLAEIILHSRSQQTHIFLITLTYYTTHSFIPSFDCKNMISSQVMFYKRTQKGFMSLLLLLFIPYQVLKEVYHFICPRSIFALLFNVDQILVWILAPTHILHIYLKLLQPTNINIIRVFLCYMSLSCVFPCVL